MSLPLDAQRRGARRRCTHLFGHGGALRRAKRGRMRGCGSGSAGAAVRSLLIAAAFAGGEPGASAFAATRREGHVVLNRLRGVRDTG